MMRSLESWPDSNLQLDRRVFQIIMDNVPELIGRCWGSVRDIVTTLRQRFATKSSWQDFFQGELLFFWYQVFVSLSLSLVVSPHLRGIIFPSLSLDIDIHTESLSSQQKQTICITFIQCYINVIQMFCVCGVAPPSMQIMSPSISEYQMELPSA